MTSDIPTAEQAEEVVADFKTRRQLPDYVKDILRAMPRDTHPMTMYSAAILSMQRESLFADQYRKGEVGKMDMWEPMYEDASNLMAKLPTIAAYAHKKSVGQPFLYPDNSLSLTENFLRMTFGVPTAPYEVDPAIVKTLDMLFVLHADHGLAASTFAARVTISTGRPGKAITIHVGFNLVAVVSLFWLG